MSPAELIINYMRDFDKEFELKIYKISSQELKIMFLQSFIQWNK